MKGMQVVDVIRSEKIQRIDEVEKRAHGGGGGEQEKNIY